MGGYRLKCLLEEKDTFPSRFGRSATIMCAEREYEVWELPLSYETMKIAYNKGSIDLPFIPRDEILEKSRRDALSKAIAITQLTWFIVQIAARVRQSLAVTELELTTATLAGLNIAMYLSWWSKPTDISRPTIVTTKDLQDITQWIRTHPNYAGASLKDIRTQQDLQTQKDLQNMNLFFLSPSVPNNSGSVQPLHIVSEKQKVNIVAHYWSELMIFQRESWTTLTSFLARLIARLVSFVSSRSKNICDIWRSFNGHRQQSVHSTLSSCSPPSGDIGAKHSAYIKNILKVISSIWNTVTQLLLALIYYPILSMLSSGSSCQTGRVEDEAMDKMATFKVIFDEKTIGPAMDLVFFCEEGEAKISVFLCFSALAGAIFGMIHCLAWNSEFPSYVEHVLWRTSSSIISGLCVCVTIATFVSSLYSTILRIRNPDWISSPNFNSRSLKIVCKTFAFSFALSRLALLSLSVAQLRNLPASAFDSVKWLEFFPHI